MIQKLFHILARLCILRHKPYVIGVTGSFGKTTARHIIAEILRKNGKNVFTPAGNYNGEWGLPLAILNVRSGGRNPLAWIRSLWGAIMTILKSQYPAILVLEYGIDHTGEMDVQCDIVEPDIALFTTLSPSHLVGFGDENGYFQEKEKLIRRKTKKTYAIGNRDDTHQSNFSCDSWYGESLQSTLTMADITSGIDGITAQFRESDRITRIVSPILGRHHIGLIAGAFLVAKHVGLHEIEILHALRDIHLPHGRGNILQGIHDSLIIDGTYNGGFEPIVAGMSLVKQLADDAGKNCIALIGDMRELGEITTRRHQELAHKIQTIHPDHLVCVGAVCEEVMKPLVPEAYFTRDARDAGRHIAALLEKSPGKYVVFAKGSQNTIYLEEALKVIIMPEEKDKLVRQDMMYLQKKEKFFVSIQNSITKKAA